MSQLEKKSVDEVLEAIYKQSGLLAVVLAVYRGMMTVRGLSGIIVFAMILVGCNVVLSLQGAWLIVASGVGGLICATLIGSGIKVIHENGRR